MDLYRALDVARLAKAGVGGSSPFVVVGGHHASLDPADCQSEENPQYDFPHPAVDAVVVGEGEETLAELVRCLEAGGDPRAVPGSVLNTPDGQVSMAVNPDGLPPPARALTQRQRARYYFGVYRPRDVAETARGYPYRCNFCSVWRFYHERFRAKSPSRVAEEVAAGRGAAVHAGGAAPGPGSARPGAGRLSG